MTQLFLSPDLPMDFSIEWGGRDAFLDDLYVLPDERGRGLGRQTLLHLAAAASQGGCVVLHLEVMAQNRARALYQRLGFVGRGSTMLTRVLHA